MSDHGYDLEKWGQPPEKTIQQYDTIEFINETPGCAECGGLLAVELRKNRALPPGDIRSIGNAMLPEPVADLVKIQCAGCGAILWER